MITGLYSGHFNDTHVRESFDDREIRCIDVGYVISNFNFKQDELLFMVGGNNNKIIKYVDEWYIVWIYSTKFRGFIYYKCDTFDVVKELLNDLLV